MQEKVDVDPTTDTQIVVFNWDDGFGVARQIPNASHWQYLCPGTVWSYQNDGIKFPTKEAAHKAAQDYLQSLALSSVVVKPSLIDRTRCRFRFKCPSCDREHVTPLKSDTWATCASVVRRKCPKTDAAISVQLWTKSRDALTAPEGNIERLPNWDCKECYGSGEYVGFTSREPCSTCMKKA
jgi:hypothetical protein